MTKIVTMQIFGKGQGFYYIPKSIYEALGWKKGDKLAITIGSRDSILTTRIKDG